MSNRNLEQLNLAKTSSDYELLNILKDSSNMNVRRAVARNLNTPSNIIDYLVYDAVLNVSYMASKNPNCTQQRRFDFLCNPCISCEEDELSLNCSKCEILTNYYKDR